MRTFTCLALLLVITACNKKNSLDDPEKPVIKTVTYHVFAQQDYTGAAYNDVNAELKLQILKTNYRTGASTTVWDTTFVQRNIRNFPLETQMLTIEKKFPVYDSKEKLTGGFAIKYTDKQFIWQEGKSDEAVPGIEQILLKAIL